MGQYPFKKCILNNKLWKTLSGKGLRGGGQTKFIALVSYIIPLLVLIPPAAFPGSADLICVARVFVGFASHSRLA